MTRRFKPGYCLGVALILMSFLQLGSQPAYADDYYAPRTTKDEQDLFNNVFSYHIPQGRKELAINRHFAAVEHAEFVLNRYPNHPQGLTLLMEACLKWGTPKCNTTTDDRFKQAIATNPEVAQTYVLFALYLHRRQRLKEAVDEYRRAIEIAPESLNAHYNLGLAYMDLKQYDLANLEAQKSYQLGASLQGLRARLEKAGKWNPNVSLPDSSASAASKDKPPGDAKPDSQPEEPPVTK